jgi:hypothetical protein
MLWEPCDRDLEIIPVVLSDMSDKVDPVSKAAFNGCPSILTSSGVAAKGEKVSAAM